MLSVILAVSSQQRCFDERSKDADGSAELLEALSRCSSLEDSCTFLIPVSQLHRCLANEAGGLKLELVLGDSRRCLGKAPPSPVAKAEKSTLRPASRRKTLHKLGQVHET